jgi:effector-binding domain-containing protein
MSDGAARPGRDDPDERPEPRIVERPDQPYAGIRGEGSMQTIPAIADRISEVIAFLTDRGLELGGPPFLRYVEIGPGDELVIEAGVPVDQPGADEEPVSYGVLPGGRFATVRHHGHPEGLMDATGDLLDWGDEQGLRWDVRYTDDREVWGCRLESYLSDPREYPDLDDWDTDLVFRLAD